MDYERKKELAEKLGKGFGTAMYYVVPLVQLSGIAMVVGCLWYYFTKGGSHFLAWSITGSLMVLTGYLAERLLTIGHDLLIMLALVDKLKDINHNLGAALLKAHSQDETAKPN